MSSATFSGHVPAIRINEALHPQHDRKAVNVRWLVATVVLGAGSMGLLGGVLQAGLHRVSKIGRPEWAITQPDDRAAGPDGRADRLVPHRMAPSAEPSPLRLQALRSTGLGDRPLTVMMADLSHMAALRGAAEPPPLLEASLGAAHDATPSRPIDLPAPIVAGSSQPAASFPAESYAEAGVPAWVEPGPLGTALNLTVEPASPPGAPDGVAVVVAQRGDSMFRLLSGFGLSANQAAEIGAALLLPVCAGGERLLVRRSGAPPGGETAPTTVRLDGTTLTAARSDNGHYRPVEHQTGRDDSPDDAAGSPVAGPPGQDADDLSVRDALWALAGQDGLGSALVATMVRVLGNDHDLGGRVANGDRLEALYGAATLDGRADQELDYASVTLGGKTARLYRFAAGDDSSVDYYDENGRSLTKFLMRKPVANGRLGDGFGWRTHPVLGDRRFHEGVDYAAPYGSPIAAAGAGVIEKIDYEPGYGKYIRIRHDLGYETTYAHVAAFPRGIAVGRRVQQGETIALIGSTGLSTGPHLYYEVKINGRNVDPLRVKLAAGRILEGQPLVAFQQRRERIDTLLRASR